MPDMMLFQGAISALRGAADIAKGLVELNTMAEVQAKAVELQQIVLSAQGSALEAQSARFGLLERIRDLENVISERDKWEPIAQRYALKKIGSSMVYALKDGEFQDEPPPFCPDIRTTAAVDLRHAFCAATPLVFADDCVRLGSPPPARCH